MTGHPQSQPMTDDAPLVERLRGWPATTPRKDAFSSHFVGAMLVEAADEIASLRSQVSELRDTWIDQNHQIDRYGIALMMIREGCADPAGLARRILSEFDGSSINSQDGGSSHEAG